MEKEEVILRDKAIERAKKISKMLYGEKWCKNGWYDETFLPARFGSMRKQQWMGDILLNELNKNERRNNK